VPAEVCAGRDVCRQMAEGCSTFRVPLDISYGIGMALAILYAPIGHFVCHWTPRVSFTLISNCTPLFQHTYVDPASQYVV
jgi:hypothetical protein